MSNTVMDGDFEYRDALPRGPGKGRGAGLQPGNRFEAVRLHINGEYLDEQAAAADVHHVDDPFNDGQAVQIKTEILPDESRTIINKVEPSPDIPFRWTINPYRGCEHGWVYYRRCHIDQSSRIELCLF